MSTTYVIEFGQVGDTCPVPPFTITTSDENHLHRAVAEHAIPFLRPVLEQLGHPEYADCFFSVSRERTYGEFMWLDLVGGQGARFCPAHITATDEVSR